jgi:DNA-binding MarR family transcriptional regulator
MPTSEAPPTQASGETLAIERRPFGQAVGFMLSQLGLEVTRRFGLLMSKVDLEARQWSVMRAISQAEGQSQNALAEFLHIPPSSMVALIDHLEARGLLERRPDPGDRRSWRLHITPAGRGVIEGAWELAAGFERTLCAGFTSDQRGQLMEMLCHVADNLGLVRGAHPEWGQGPSGDEDPAVSS